MGARPATAAFLIFMPGAGAERAAQLESFRDRLQAESPGGRAIQR